MVYCAGLLGEKRLKVIRTDRTIRTHYSVVGKKKKSLRSLVLWFCEPNSMIRFTLNCRMTSLGFQLFIYSRRRNRCGQMRLLYNRYVSTKQKSFSKCFIRCIIFFFPTRTTCLIISKVLERHFTTLKHSKIIIFAS